LHYGPIGSVKDRFQPVPVVDNVNVYTRLLLIADSLNQAVFREAREFFAEFTTPAGVKS
jgi:hypothetical protein